MKDNLFLNLCCFGKKNEEEQSTGTEVLIQWKDNNPEDAVWKELYQTQLQFPDSVVAVVYGLEIKSRLDGRDFCNNSYCRLILLGFESDLINKI